MIRCLALIAISCAAPITAFATAPGTNPSISQSHIRENVRVLSSDAFQGRGPGEAAESKTLDYLVGQFRAAGLRPGAPEGGWLQAVPLVRYDRDPQASVRIETRRGARGLVVGRDVTLASHAVGHSRVERAPVVFAGYGIDVPGWNDFAGADLKGKVVLLLGNDPDFEAAPGSAVYGRFGGRALAYAGRLGVKVGAAMAAGALGVLVVHEDAAMSWPWRQAQNSDRLPSMAPAPDPAARPDSFNGMIRRDVAEELLRSTGYDLARLKALARTPGFRPLPLDLKVSADFNVHARTIVSHNVVARLPGRAHPGEVVLYGAHWDANGRGAPDETGDDIRNGAVDNATGTAELLEVARAFARSGPRSRTLVFVAYTAEEKGLLGSDFYAGHPADPLERTAAVINLDPHVMLGRARNLELVGPGQTDLEADLADAARAEGLRVDPEPYPEAGWYFRSDHYSFAKRGVPSLSFRIGRDLVAGGLPVGMAHAADYNFSRYHQPKDEFDPQWSFEGAAQEAAVAWRVGAELADARRWPAWRPGVDYAAVRAKSDAARPAEATGGGAASLDAEREAVRGLRAANNAALAARDLGATMAIAADDYVLVTGNDAVHRSRGETRDLWVGEFADPAGLPCVRTPDRIAVGDYGGVRRAAETGAWECPKATPRGEAQRFGQYLAHWSKRSGAWRVVSDNYVALGCRGPGCD